MKKIQTMLVMLLILATLAGCQARTEQPTGEVPTSQAEQTSSFSGGETEPTFSESTGSEETKQTEDTDNEKPPVAEAPSESQETTASQSIPTQGKNTVTTPEKKQETPAEESKAPTQPPKPTEKPAETSKPTEPPAEQKPTEKPKESEPTSPAEPQPTEPPAQTPKSIYDYEFDVEAIRQELIAIGTGMGLTVDSSLTPSNASWANPVTASQSFQGSGLERSLKDYVRSMPSIITAYGGDPIQYFTVYAENLGGGSYRFYFLY